MARKTAVAQATARQDVPEIIPCAHDECGQAARSRVLTKTGYANLCPEHYEAHFTRANAAWANERFLTRQIGESSDEYVARMREVLRDAAKARGAAEPIAGTWRKIA